MKVRNGFVSNSSSCSFTINTLSKTGITRKQIEQLMDSQSAIPAYEVWCIQMKDGIIKGISSTGNGGIEMKRYLEDVIKISRNLITWEHE
jgi:hypothetical protein